MDRDELLIKLLTDLVKKVDDGFERVGTRLTEHEKEDLIKHAALELRVVPLETMQKVLRKYQGLLIAALLGAGADFLFDHLPRIASKLR